MTRIGTMTMRDQRPCWPTAMGVVTVALWSVFLVATVSAGELADSFEDGVPRYWKQTRKDALSASAAHSKHGTKSLRWNWKKGDVLAVSHGIGDVTRTGGPDDCRKAAFGLWIWNGTPLASKLVFDFCEGDQVTASFDVPLDFKGWRRVQRPYAWKPQMTGRPTAKTDAIRIKAPEDAGEGTLFFDLMVYNGLADSRAPSRPDPISWKPFQPDPAIHPLSESLDADLAGAVEQVRDRVARDSTGKKDVLDEKEFAKLAVRCATFGIVRTTHGVSGDPIVGDPAFYESAGLRDFRKPDTITDLMLRLAKGYHRADAAARRTELAKLYLELYDHLIDQGFVVGGDLVFSEQKELDVAVSAVLMSTILRKTKRLGLAGERFDYAFGARKLFDLSEASTSTEYFVNDARYQLLGALLQPTLERQFQWLNAYGKSLSAAIQANGSSGFQADGAFLRDGAFSATATVDALDAVANHVYLISKTPFAISNGAYARLKKALLALRFCSNTGQFPLSINDGHKSRPFPSKPLFLIGVSAHGGDRNLLGAMLRLHPDKRWPGHAAERTPKGNVWLPSAGLMAHRRKEWLTSLKVTGSKQPMASTANGRWTDLGYLDVMTEKGRYASGCRPLGWDNSRLGGTTVPLNPKNSPDAKAPEPTFTGGLSQGGDGIAALRFQDPETGLRATKSYAFFDDVVVCLGSGIAIDSGASRTNLLQISLGAGSKTLVVDGNVQTDAAKTFPATKDHVILDPVGTCYYLPKGQSLHVGVKRQTKADGTRKPRQVSEAQIANAWVDHGKTTNEATYHYVVLVGLSEADRKDALKHLRSPEGPFVVHRKDSRAHIVQDTIVRGWACAFFQGGKVDLINKGLPIASVDGPCVVMLGQDDKGQTTLSVGTPSVKGRDPTKAASITLATGWKTINAPDIANIGMPSVPIPSKPGKTATYIIIKKGD